MRNYVVCFDITDDKSRFRVGKLLGECGNRVQRSVYEIFLQHDKDLTLLKRAIQPLLDSDDDCRFYFLCKDCSDKSHTADDHKVLELPGSVVI